MRNSCLSLLVLIALSATGFSQQCPNWSSYFDQIDDPTYLQPLQEQRSQGWTSITPPNASIPSLQQDIAAGEQNIQKLQQGIREAQQAWAATSAGNAPMPSPSTAQCNANHSANIAAACQAHLYRNMLLLQEGTVDLMRCRAGMSAGSYMSVPSVSSRASTTYPSNSTSTAYERGASSVADLNVSKRASMVDSVAKGWQPPVEQDAVEGSLAQSTNLADPFAESKGNGIASTGEATVESGGTTNQAEREDSSTEGALAKSDSSSGWSDPASPDVVTHETEPAPSQPTAELASPNVAEVTQTLNDGTAVAAATEVSPTPVAQVADASDWDQFIAAQPRTPSNDTMPPPPDERPQPDATDEQIDRGMLIAGKEKDALSKMLPHNDISDAIMDNGIKIIGSEAHQMNHVLNDLDGALRGDVPVEKINSDIEGFGPALTDPLIPDSVKTLDRELTKFKDTVTKKVNSISCMFSFDPYCK